MSMQDPIANMLTCLRNAQMVGEKVVRLPHSRLKADILKVLQEEGYIENFEVLAADKKKSDKIKKLQVNLKYYQGAPVIEKIKRVSRPGLRVYSSYTDLPVVRGGLGIVIVSTPMGVMADKKARSHRVGGEVLCIVE